MFYARYVLAELRRRRGRTILTALGLGVGVALVVVVSALSAGLDDAQDEVLKPLTGVGTDMSVTRPIDIGSQGFQNLSQADRNRLREENGPPRLRLQGDPGEHFSRDDFATTQLSFSGDSLSKIRAIDGVDSATGGLTLNAIHVEGTIPEQSASGGQFGPPGGGAGPPQDLDFDSRSITGVDPAERSLGALSEGQLTSGKWFSAGDARELIVSRAYAQRKDVDLGDKLKIKGHNYAVVGISSPPLGGQASDLYMKLDQLQSISDRKNRVNTVYVRADSGSQVGEVSKAIESTITGAEVTTSADLADRVGGSLSDAKDLSGKLGTALAVVGLLAAVLIAVLLTLSSVAKRTRELGTLKAIGWSQRRVVRQVSAESIVQGLLGGLVGAVIGVAACALIGQLGLTLEASVSGASQSAAAQGPGPGGAPPGAPPGGPGGGPIAQIFGQGQVASGAKEVALSAPVDVQILFAAIALAILGGLVAGAAGGLRAARLRPAAALRYVE